MQWYYAVNSQRLGPVSATEFEQLVRDGVIKADTLVWQQGMGEWRPYASVGATAAASTAQAGTGDETEVCVVSGKRHPRREMVQYEGKWISAERRDEFFQRLREGVAGPKDFNYAGFWVRFCAKFLDGLITGVVGVLFNLCVALALFGHANYFGKSLQGEGLPKVLLFQAISILFSVSIGLTYAWFFISRFQATPGKIALGLKIVRADGSRLTTGRIIGRHFAEMISGFTLAIGYIMAAFDEEKRSLHDRICDTRVIKAK